MYQQYATLLREKMPSSIEILDDQADFADVDILHIVACWDHHASRLAEKAVKMGIPYIISPMGGISPWNLYKPRTQRLIQKFRYQRSMVRKASAILATDELEREFIVESKWNSRVYRVSNCIFTGSIAASDMTHEIAKVYEDVFQHFEKEHAEKIAAKVNGESAEHKVVEQIMLIYDRMPHQNIPMNRVKTLKALLYTTEYSDDEVEKILKKVKLTTFAQQLFAAMSKKVELTEGFMPMAPKNDSRSKTIGKYMK